MTQNSRYTCESLYQAESLNPYAQRVTTHHNDTPTYDPHSPKILECMLDRRPMLHALIGLISTYYLLYKANIQSSA